MTSKVVQGPWIEIYVRLKLFFCNLTMEKNQEVVEAKDDDRRLEAFV